MSRQDHKKRVWTQRIDESAQAAVDGLVYVTQRVFTGKPAGCSPVLWMVRIASGPQLMSCAMGFAKIEHEQIPGTSCEHRERKVHAAGCPLDQPVLESAKLMRALTNKITGAYRIFAGDLLNLLLQRWRPTGERVPHDVLAPERHLKCSWGACDQRVRHVD
jgi:hypothetical protein